MAQNNPLGGAMRACYEGREEQLEAHLMTDISQLTALTDEGYSCFHLAIASENVRVLQILVGNPTLLDLINVIDSRGLTCLHMAANNGRADMVKILLENGADLAVIGPSGRTVLHYACRHTEVIKLVVSAIMVEKDKLSLFDLCDLEGYTPIHTVCALAEDEDEASLETVKLLAQHCTILNNLCKAGDTALMTAAKRGRPRIVQQLLDAGADPAVAGAFGATALHQVIANGADLSCTRTLVAHNPKLALAQDDDGLTPLHGLASALAKGLMPVPDIVGLLKDSIDYKDYANCTALTKICFHAANPAALPLITAFLDHGSDCTLEYDHGWNAMHVLHSILGPESLLLARMKEIAHQKQYVFDATKRRNVDNTGFYARRGSWNRIPLEARNNVLRGLGTLEGIARRILEHRSSKIVVLAGAGISTNCGIPDFRSQNGIYSNEDTRRIFDGRQFYEDPSIMYSGCAKLFGSALHGPVKLSMAHRFFALLERKNLLLRIYTQNVDGLEKGIISDHGKIRECHGTLSSSHCIKCERDAHGAFLEGVRQGCVSTCQFCDGFIRPNVVFFGEPLSQDFNLTQYEDFKQTDLVMVLGTSLQVYPFASLCSMADSLTPRLLINREHVGSFSAPYRDVVALGDIDEQIFKLVDLLGWQRDLDEIPEEINKSIF